MFAFINNSLELINMGTIKYDLNLQRSVRKIYKYLLLKNKPITYWTIGEVLYMYLWMEYNY